jgi:ABC-type proline/glycine betaine transport system permease subunit
VAGRRAAFALRRPRAGQNRGVGVLRIGVAERVGFSPRVLSSRLFLPLFVLYLFFILYIKEKTGRFKLLCEMIWQIRLMLIRSLPLWSYLNHTLLMVFPTYFMICLFIFIREGILGPFTALVGKIR